MNRTPTGLISRAAQTVAAQFRDMMTLRCAQGAGETDVARARALCDRMLSDDHPAVGSIAEIVAWIDRAGADRRLRTARLRALLVGIADDIAVTSPADDDPRADAVAAA